MIEIYGTPTWTACKTVVNMCKANNIAYMYSDLSVSQKLVETVGERIGRPVTTVPVIFMEGNFLSGGLVELKNKLFS